MWRDVMRTCWFKILHTVHVCHAKIFHVDLKYYIYVICMIIINKKEIIGFIEDKARGFLFETQRVPHENVWKDCPVSINKGSSNNPHATFQICIPFHLIQLTMWFDAGTKRRIKSPRGQDPSTSDIRRACINHP